MYHNQRSLTEQTGTRDGSSEEWQKATWRRNTGKMFMGDLGIQSSQVMNYISDLKAPAALPRIFNSLTLVLHVYDFFFIKMTLTNKF